MSEEKNKEGSSQPQAASSKHGKSELKNDQHETKPVTSNQQQATTNMEVHKHPHHVTHKKKWGEYLLEFFMLFLAVFLGFLAENFREHQVEKERAKQYIISFCEDLKKDTVRINQLIKYDDEKIAALSGMYSCYDTVLKNVEATGCMGQLIKHSRSNKGFVLTERTIRQLANAGGYRLLNKEDADSIIAYENAYKGYLDFQTTVFQNAQDNVRNTLNRFANFKVIAPLQLTTATLAGDTIDGRLSGPLFFGSEPALMNQWFNELALYLRTTNGQRNIMMQLKEHAVGLLRFYNNKYHLDK
jgi:hypothetical protein